jgi:5-hydroxyisourate hydrolase-like protein (transthyretin family)
MPAAAAVTYGQDAVFSGTATNADGTPAAGLQVSLQKVGNGGTWVTIEHATTAADGSWSARHRWVRAGRVRALLGAAVSPSVVVDAVPLLQARSQARRVQAGGVIALNGTVKPAAAVHVLVERKDSRGRWQRVNDVRVTVRRQGFSVRVRLRSAGLYRLTARTGTRSSPIAAPAVYVRAVRHAVAAPPSGGTPA